jgi:sigma-B regulation protein RsbU (phosphoserine phosphatase)
VEDVLGAGQAAQLWEEELLPLAEADAEVWVAALPEVMRRSQARLGRGLARELNQQLRLALEDYRT